MGTLAATFSRPKVMIAGAALLVAAVALGATARSDVIVAVNIKDDHQ